MKEANNK